MCSTHTYCIGALYMPFHLILTIILWTYYPHFALEGTNKGVNLDSQTVERRPIKTPLQ